ncbi:hypothetical protein CYMTET_5957 [Cymbomonas tetramitiformis]|uniref:Saposin B-type domain-containing protein n=1 Tax=Cymbomonas tetramitiformis TaxID=36881 RepID=A0AAE0H030_9CHLO|nr:hypothetical protein CYMTET_5957 [Cymbomonas tetramitiformis]|eukprot:gene14874-17586_t
MVFGDDPRKPVEVNDELLCEACHAIFDQVNKKIGEKGRTETNIYEAVEGICDSKNFRVYKMIPPTMVKGCQAFIDKYEGLEDDMWKYGSEAEEKVCESVCQSVKYEAPKAPGSSPPPEKPKKKSKKKKSKKAKQEKEEL